MRSWVIMLLCIGAVFPCVSSSGAGKSHTMSLVRAEKLRMNKAYVKQFYGTLRKVNKNTKVLDGNMTILADLEGNAIECEVKIYQLSGPKYVKAPVDIPKKPLCEHMETNPVVWPCIRNHTNLPLKCPVPKGTYWIKNMDPNDCDFGDNLPPNMAEDYKVEGTCWKGLEEVAYLVGYGKLKKKMMTGTPKGFGRR